MFDKVLIALDTRTLAGRFQTLEQIAVGGMGAVYRALDLQTMHTVAVKLLTSRGDDAETRFAREAELLSELAHPHIVRYIAHGVDAGDPYLVMEWIEGQTLADRMDHQGLTVQECMDVVRLLGEALYALHSRKRVHRDIKPANVILRDGKVEQLTLLDFGVARKTDEIGPTRTGIMVGSSGYMAPEQARGQKDVDARVDVFALGCVLYECLTGVNPFEGQGMTAVWAKVLLVDPTPPAVLNKDIGPALNQLVMRLLSKRVADRPDDGREVAKEVGALPRSSSTTRRVRGKRPKGGADSTSDARTGIMPPTTGGLAPTETHRATIQFVIMIGEPEELTDPSHLLPDEVDVADPASKLDAIVEQFGGHLEHLQGGSRVAILAGTEAQEVTLRAGRCALALRGELPELPIVISADDGNESPAEAIDRGTAVLAAESMGNLFAASVDSLNRDRRVRLEASAVPFFERQGKLFRTENRVYLVELRAA